MDFDGTISFGNLLTIAVIVVGFLLKDQRTSERVNAELDAIREWIRLHGVECDAIHRLFDEVKSDLNYMKGQLSRRRGDVKGDES